MYIRKMLVVIVAGVATLGALGCDLNVSGHHRHEQAYVAPQPHYVEQQPTYVIVQQAPPPMRIESRPRPPAATTYVWVDGYWSWDNQRYTWQEGRYVVPPQRDVIWIAPRYDQDSRGYRYTPGQWASQPQGNGRGRGRGN